MPLTVLVHLAGNSPPRVHASGQGQRSEHTSSNLQSKAKPQIWCPATMTTLYEEYHHPGVEFVSLLASFPRQQS
jgi:hypothetical protein